MAHLGISVGIPLAVGFVTVYLLPPPWLVPISTVAAVLCFIFATVARVETKTEPPSNRITGFLLLVANLPEQPLAKVKEGWALSWFYASTAFLVSLGLSVMALANA
jgi:hypothetical protein